MGCRDYFIALKNMCLSIFCGILTISLVLMHYEPTVTGGKSTEDSKNGHVDMVYICLLSWVSFYSPGIKGFF